MNPLMLLPFLLVSQPSTSPAKPVAPAASPVEAPRLTIQPRGLVELGSLGPQGAALQSYEIKNVSKAPIRLQAGELPPGITVSGPALGEPIPADGTRALSLAVNAQERTGTHLVRVVFSTDDPRQGTYFLPVHYLVRPDLTVDSERKVLLGVGPHESPQAVFTFKRETGQSFALKLAEALPPYLETDLQASGGTGTLQVVLRPGQVPDGMRGGLETLKVQTSAPRESAFTLYLNWGLTFPVEAQPTRLVFQDVKTTVLRTTLSSGAGRAFQVLEARIEGEGFTVDAPSPNAKGQVQLTVHRTAAMKARAVLVVRLGDGLPTLRIPLRYLPPES